MESAKIIVNGKVQGVAFRYYTKIKADELNLKGTVQNLEDGSVCILVSGSTYQVKKLVSWCKDGGSPAAIVNQVIMDELDTNTSQRFINFSIIR